MSQRAPRNTPRTAYHPNESFIQPPRGPPRPAPSPNKLYMTKISVGFVKVLYISDVHICHALVQTALPPGRGNEPQPRHVSQRTYRGMRSVTATLDTANVVQ